MLWGWKHPIYWRPGETSKKTYTRVYFGPWHLGTSNRSLILLKQDYASATPRYMGAQQSGVNMGALGEAHTTVCENENSSGIIGSRRCSIQKPWGHKT